MTFLRALASALVPFASSAVVLAQGGPLFIEAARDTGLVFTHTTSASGRYYLPEMLGSGAAVFDYDNDGDLDVFLVQGGPTATAPAVGPGAGTRATSRLFRNDLTIGPGGERTLRFTDVTDKAGVALAAQGMGVAVGDYNNDGWLDLFVTTFGPDFLFRNNGNGTFTNATREAGVSDPLWSSSASFLDYDRDGDLDLFVVNYVAFTIENHRQCREGAGVPDYCTPSVYAAVPDRLYRNEGNGRFTNVTDAAGISRAFGKGLGVVAGDFDNDGWLDVYVANDGTPNQLWMNQRNGTFVDRGPLSGAAFNAAGFPEASMGIAAGDFDADGDEDLFITNLVQETFVLYANDGQGLFDDARTRTGVGPRTGAYTGFGTDWFDYDNDGWLDLFVTNGAVNIVPKLRGQPRPYRMINQLFHNNGKGWLDEVPSSVAGPDFSTLEVGRGAAFGDLDNDGDIDIVVTSNGGPARLLINQTGSRAPWVQIRFDQGAANRLAVGAWVGLHRAGHPTLWRRVKTDGSYLSASDSRLHFGLGASPATSAIEVRWPDGGRERFVGIEAGRLVTLKRGTGAAAGVAR
jgi:hypothetical protein